MPEPPEPFVLTLKLDRDTFERLDALRQAHFPRARNFLPAHLTLFHALPGDHADAIRRQIRRACAATPLLPLDLPGVRFLGRGVAAEVAAPGLLAVRARLAAEWSGWLSAQDRQGYRPHITIQNKATPEQARRLYAKLAAEWAPLQAHGEGLLLWRYQGGPWALSDEFAFSSPSPKVKP